jgi:CubicO group peptidase (beta-lactamase class C family)
MSSAVDDVLRNAVETGAVPNVVAVAADRDGIRYQGAAGPRAVGSPGEVAVDSVLWIASMTKMVTTVAALQLRERGKLDFDASVAEYLSEWDKMQVLEGFAGDTPRLRQPTRRATVGQLATHTAGQTYWFWNADMVRYEELTGHPNVISGTTAALFLPLVVDPGTKFEYGTNTDWLGRVVEEVAGQRLDTYFAEHITGPLGMVDTVFGVDEERRERKVALHFPAEGGGWVASDMELPADPDYWSGGHGLYSTAQDYLRFARMLLAGGVFSGSRILAEDTVAEAFTNRIGGLEVPERVSAASPAHSCDFVYGPDRKWGWGLLLNTKDEPGRRRAGSGAWAGLANTHFWIDPTSGITGAIFSQYLPFATPGYVQMYADFEKAIYDLV